MGRIIAWGIRNPRKLFLIDAAGAILSIFLLGYILVELVNFFGIPLQALNVLVIFPCLYLIFDLFCILRRQLNIRLGLSVIASLNLFYCVLAVGSAFYFHDELTIFGWLFVISDIVVVMAVSIFELMVARLV